MMEAGLREGEDGDRRVFEHASYQIEKRNIKNSGEILCGGLTASRVLDGAARPLHLFGALEDIGERKPPAVTRPCCSAGPLSRSKLKVVAEGVETEGQQGLLIANPCDEIQGYHFSPPLPPGSATETAPAASNDANPSPERHALDAA